MNDNGTSCTTSRRSGVHQGNSKRHAWRLGWWILWGLFAQVDCLTAEVSRSYNASGAASLADMYLSFSVKNTGTTDIRVTVNNYSQYFTIAPGVTSPVGQCQYRATFSGLVIGTPQTLPCVNGSAVRTLKWRVFTGGSWVETGSQLEPQAEGLTATATRVASGGSANFSETLTPNIVLEINGAAVTRVGDPYAAAGPITTLEKFFGKTLNVPFYVAAGVASVDVEINGEHYTFPVDVQEGDSGGVAMLALPIPQGWNGAAKINGVDVALAPRVAYTGDPTMGVTANPYQDATEPLALPPGMTRGVPQMPAGMTPQTYYGLPPGMTAGNKLPLPPGVSSISQTAPVAGTLPVGVTKTDGGMGWVNVGPTGTAKPTSGGGTTTTVTGGTGTGDNTELTDADRDAIGEAGATGDYSSDMKEAGTGLKGLGTQWNTLKATAQNKFGAFQPMATGSLPRASSLDMNFDFGSFGSRHVNIDLTQPPFSTARAIALVLLVAGSGWFFLKFAKV